MISRPVADPRHVEGDNVRVITAYKPNPNAWWERSEDKEKQDMKCRVCGSMLHSKTTDLPFKVSDRTIVILKRLPVEQCEGCSEYLIADAVFAKVEQLLASVDTSAELEIIQFAA